MFESDDGKEFVNGIFDEIVNENIIRRSGRYCSKGATSLDNLVKVLEIFLKKFVLEKDNANWIDEIMKM